MRNASTRSIARQRMRNIIAASTRMQASRLVVRFRPSVRHRESVVPGAVLLARVGFRAVVQAEMDPMDLLSAYHQAMIKAVRRVLTEHHAAAAADLRKLIKEHPLLRSATLAELFGLEKGATGREAYV